MSDPQGDRGRQTRRAVLLLLAFLAGCASSAGDGGMAEEDCGDTIAREVRLAPTFTPHHERPQLIDAEHFLSELQSNLSAALPEGAELEPVEGWLLISDRGCVARVVLDQTTASVALDSVLEAQWQGTEWTRPLVRYGSGLGRERVVPVWIKVDLINYANR